MPACAHCAGRPCSSSPPQMPILRRIAGAARDFIQRWKGHPLIVPAVSPHAPYTCTEEILRATAALAVEFDVPLHTHLAETALEVENMRREQGMPVIPYVRNTTCWMPKCWRRTACISTKAKCAPCCMPGRRCAQPFFQPEAGLGDCPGKSACSNWAECWHWHRWPGLEQ
jgi:hypothetical protein